MNWVEPSAWTERMLKALETGVKGRKWFSLIDKVYNLKNLEASFKKVKANKGTSGVDHQTISMFEANLERNLKDLSEKLRLQTYKPNRIRKVEIPKPGSKEKRILGIPTVRDRVVQTALRNVIEPIFEKDFNNHSYGFRPKRGCKDALRRVEKLLRRGHQYVVEVDIRKCFDRIPHEELIKCVESKVSDGRILSLIDLYLKEGVLDEPEKETLKEGTPQGSAISPLLANIYLDALDHDMQAKGYEIIRYADDAVIMCQNRKEAQEAMGEVRQWMQNAKLQLHSQKTRIAEAEEEGFNFLGYHFQKKRKWPRKQSLQKVQHMIRRKTRRTNGQSLAKIISDVNQTTKGWFEYFQHSHWYTFQILDGWIRMRMRSILRKRSGRKGTGHGWDHRRWPNSYFSKHGLFSLSTAHALSLQSV